MAMNPTTSVPAAYRRNRRNASLRLGRSMKV